MEQYTDQELRKIIINHYTESKNRGFTNSSNSLKIDLNSPTCSDELTLEIEIENTILRSLKFEGSACVIATAAADMIINKLLNKNKSQALAIITNFEDLIKLGKQDAFENDSLLAFKNVHKQRNRIMCATLLSDGIKKFLQEN
ncbi:FeS assembly protein [Williamsoniiplasma somnilux]|uniref:FeS assembly protein n=1 Tax=Williamsoniiplasma somnilux TaxID=215578 RepID=A0A2K8NZJ5_9MOLU|nr:iron-sulfur cluster assembly scaffold protein [Williamsoniiplasma somnilux]ATZ18638.1 FeS assembly protein [Williamsoniiplasma somnilux]